MVPELMFWQKIKARISKWVAISYSRGSSCPGIEPASPVSPALKTDFVHVVVHTATGNSCVPHLTILLREEKKEKKKHLTKIAHLLAPSLIPVGKSQGKPTWTQGNRSRA
ncbi:unnamed protein product [Rangifer tarandus platyrhynchus]|uniref:Uncharacterized protein n=1 Tax=Rangifer tarandus platyrhynchus TaxID=3082113 RepID=A0ACB1MKV8_RANTA